MITPALRIALTMSLAAPFGIAAQAVAVEHVANVGDTVGGPGYLGSLSDLVILNDGRIVLSDLRNPGVRLFDSDGSFVRSLGGIGEGPGEYSETVILVPGQSGGVELFSPGRMITLAEDLSHQSTRRDPSDVASLEMIRVGDHLVRARARVTPESVGLPLHVFSGDIPRFVRSFGADPPIRSPRERLLHARRLAPSSDSTFWSADLLRFRLQHWTVQGDLIGEIVRSPAWFPPQERIGIDPVQGPRPWLNAIAHDSISGVLWVATLIAREDWADAPTRNESGARTGQPGVDARIESEWAYRTIIEAVDPDTGEVLGSAEIGAKVVGISNRGYAYAEGRTKQGEPVARVWRLSHRGPVR